MFDSTRPLCPARLDPMRSVRKKAIRDGYHRLSCAQGDCMQPTRHQPRLACLIKWVLLAFCVLLACLWLTSSRWSISRRDMRPGRRLSAVAFVNGAISVAVITDPKWDWSVRDTRPQWSIDSIRAEHRAFRWLPELQPLQNPGVPWFTMLVPTWIPLTVLLVPTACIWWRARSVRAGYCKRCGYSLKGLRGHAPCPECGHLTLE